MVLIIHIRILPLSLALSLLLCGGLRAFAEERPETHAQACVLMYADGSCVYEKNADTRHLIASTTKLMTAILCVENGGLDEPVQIKAHHCEVEGSSMYLNTEKRYTVRELLLGLLLASGNDAALALAEHVSDSESAFVRRMNSKAAALGMLDTSFANPHGLDAMTHYSTARDLAKLMLYCMENEVFRSLVSTHAAEISGQRFVNHNRLLAECPGCIGGKTGYTKAAGRCLVSCCERDGLRFVCVTLSDPDDWRDHTRLYDWAYDSFVLRDVTEELRLEVPVLSGSRSSIRVTAGEPVPLLLRREEHVKLRAELPKFVFAPVKKGETAGTICVIIQNRVAAECPLVYAESAHMAYPVWKPVFQEERLP